MRFLTIALLLITFSYYTCAQVERIPSDNIADCDGATQILQPGTYSLQFTGEPGNVKDLTEYPSLKEMPEKNSAWCSFRAPFDGRLSLDAAVPAGKIQLIIFQNETNDICEDVLKGKAEIKRLIQNPSEASVSISLITGQNSLYPLDLKKDERVLLFFQSTEKSKTVLNFTLKFEGINGEGSASTMSGQTSKLIDLRKSGTSPFVNIMVRDYETGNAVIADLTIAGNRMSSSLYSGSDFLFTIEKSGKINVKCDAPGYFFNDREEPLSMGSDHELVIWMKPLGQGKSFQIEEIEFKPGTSEFMPSADSKLRRLRDFLALNSGVRVEIQGHVHDTGDKNTLAAQKLSEARAKRVMNYLVDNGIDKSRMVAKGYGNTVPIYEKPKFAYEEQANRRVEIKIL